MATYSKPKAPALWGNPYQGTSPLFDPFPARIMVKMRYSQLVELAATAGAADHWVFRCNSIYDPDASGAITGHQPYGHDTYAQIYNHYKVKSASITMTPTINNNGMYGITLTDDTTVSGSFDTIREIKSTRMQIASNTGGQCVTNYYNQNQVFPSSTDQLGANFGANPVEQQYFDCWHESRDVGSATTTPFLINIVYYVEMWELRDLGQS